MKRSDNEWTVFSTAFGVCGITWASGGVTSFHLPEVPGGRIEKKLIRLTGQSKPASAVPSLIKEVIRRVRAHLKGEPQDFSDVPVYLDQASKFQLCVYTAARKIPSGKVLTYGKLAELIKKPKAARAVGTALAKNPIPLIVPCHRVIAASGKLGGFSAPGGLRTKAKLLQREGAGL